MDLNIKKSRKFIKNIGILLGVFICFASTVQAKSITTYAKSLERVSMAKPVKTFQFETLESVLLFDGSYLNGGSVIKGDIIEVQKPKRGKKDSCFEVIPTTITCNGHVTVLAHPAFTIMVSEYNQIDKKQVAGSVARTGLGFVIPGAAQGISFVQGVAQAPEGEKIQSGIHKIYTDSFISYIGKGKYITLKQGDTITITFEEIK